MKKLIKVLSMMLIIFGMLAVNTVTANAEWRNNSKGWWYTEGDSYVKNCWKEINEKWYYFDYDGYMIENQFINGYYLDQNGVWSEGSEEIQAYIKVLSDLNLLKNKYDIYSEYRLKENIPYDAKFIDMNEDGIYEALVYLGQANATDGTIVFGYKNGEVKLISRIYPRVYYCKEKKALIDHATSHGVNPGRVYKYEDCSLIELHSFQYNWREGNPPPKCVIDGKGVSEEGLKNFFEQYITDEEGEEFFSDL